MTLIDGKKIANEILEELKEKIKNLKKKPRLAVFAVGNNAASKIYIKNKRIACEKVGVRFEEYNFPEKSSEQKILDLIQSLNENSDVNGILVQLPLPAHINKNVLINKILPEKDVDGFCTENIGKMALGENKFAPCTPKGIIKLLKRYKIEISGKHCVVLGRSNIVGKPLALMLLNENATVTVCHSKTKNIEEFCKTADILISAVGKKNLVTASMVKNGAVVIDVGINRDANGKISGDVDFENVKNVASYITPVPGGVGPMTVAMLIHAVCNASRL